MNSSSSEILKKHFEEVCVNSQLECSRCKDKLTRNVLGDHECKADKEDRQLLAH